MTTVAGRPMWLPFAALAGGVLAADQLSKAWLTSFLDPGRSTSVVGDLVRFVHSRNSGGLFGLLSGQAVPFALLSLVVVGAIVVYHGRAGRDPLLTLTLGLLLGGALGNLTDRLRIGYVVDWVDAGIGDVRWYTFNVADAAISLSIVLLLWAAIRPMVGRWGR